MRCRRGRCTKLLSGTCSLLVQFSDPQRFVITLEGHVDTLYVQWDSGVKESMYMYIPYRYMELFRGRSLNCIGD